MVIDTSMTLLRSKSDLPLPWICTLYETDAAKQVKKSIHHLLPCILEWCPF
jgi:hypothetical protein